jgi:DMSO/TMAO reductase YedYZ molybdopterin-dependent catalytic subunit
MMPINPYNLTRRNFLLKLASLPAALAVVINNSKASALTQSPPVTIANASNSRAFPFDKLNSWITPNEQFFVRSHFGIPKINSSHWTIEVTGAVERPRTFTLEEILQMPAQEEVITLECAGNLVGWGGVSNARWRGVRLGALLEACKLRSDAIEAVMIGADGGSEVEAGGINVPAFARAIPIQKALDKNTLLAYRMNDEPLPAMQGGPVRAVIPGYYGMDSVKWIKQIVVGRESYKGFYNTERYYEARRINGKLYRNELHEMRIKSQFARPVNNQRLPLATTQIVGAAWTNGDAEITKVELSFNRGKSWVETKLGEERAPFAWRLWSLDWQPTQAGIYEIIARAHDSKEREQPSTRDTTLITPYAQNHADRRIIEVR